MKEDIMIMLWGEAPHGLGAIEAAAQAWEAKHGAIVAAHGLHPLADADAPTRFILYLSSRIRMSTVTELFAALDPVASGIKWAFTSRERTLAAH